LKPGAGGMAEILRFIAELAATVAGLLQLFR
jgi:hypothetical protein